LQLFATKQGVALTGRNITGPLSRAAPGELSCITRVLQTTADDRRQTTTDASDSYKSGPLHYVQASH